MFAEAQQQRHADTATASNFLYVRIQELESALISQRMLLEQSRQRETVLHRTVEGFSQLLAKKQATLSELEERITLLQEQEVAAQQRARILGLEVDSLNHERRALLLEAAASRGSGSRGSPNASTSQPRTSSPPRGGTPLLLLNGAPTGGSFGSSAQNGNYGPTTTYGSFEAHDALLRETATLKRQLDIKTQEANATMVALNSLLNVKQRLAEGKNNGSNATVIEDVAQLVLESLDARRRAELDLSGGNTVSVPAFAQHSRLTTSSRHEGGSGGDDGSGALSYAAGSSRSSAAKQLLERENLELKEQLASLLIQPSTWSIDPQ